MGATTINRYLDKHGLLDVKISERIKTAHKAKLEQKQKSRPPKEIKDWKPGALVEKDMKFILKIGRFVNWSKPKAKENFWYQHTVIDSFTRLRTIGLAEDSESKTAVAVQEECEVRFPFPIACANTDNGGENEKDFDDYLENSKNVERPKQCATTPSTGKLDPDGILSSLEAKSRGSLQNS